MHSLIDTHCHLDINAFDDDRIQVLEHARNAGVRGFVIPAIERDNWPAVISLCQTADDLYPALGLHPVFIDKHQDNHLQELAEWISREQPHAVGEIGLDFYIQETDRQRQIFFFESQLDCASQFNLPVLLHIRKAHDEVLQSLRRIHVKGGICHAFNGSLQQAKQYMDMGFKLGFGGMLTYERSTRLRQLARDLPLEAIVLETDAPDMTGAAHQYQRNSPEYLPEVLQALADIRTEDAEQIARETSRNARQVLSLP